MYLPLLTDESNQRPKVELGRQTVEPAVTGSVVARGAKCEHCSLGSLGSNLRSATHKECVLMI